MHAHDRPMPKLVGTLLAVATILGACPPTAVADPPRATVEQTETTILKKSKRKRSWSTSPGNAFAALPKGAERTPAEIAVAAARDQLGKPYRYGSTGPSSFDCSGLTGFAWAAAGVHLPRSSRAQFSSLRRVPFDRLQPGDIVYRPGHVGLYIGKGRMIHAPQSGHRIEIAPLDRHVGAVRPG